MTSFGQQPRFKVLAVYSTNAEPDHVQFAQDALKFFSSLAARGNFTFESTTRWEDLTDERLKDYRLVMWLNESPAKPEQRAAFERYMQHGGAWLGFHAAGYNDKDTNWPWFVDFLGGAVFHTNSWPPLPAHLVVDDPYHPVLAGVTGALDSPANEWYVWKPSPRLNPDVRVLISFDPANYPLGFKDVLTSGDLPVVWTNTKYKMIYMNMGHGDKIFSSPVQNKLFESAVNWLASGAIQTAPTEASGIQISPHGVALNSKTGKFYAVNSRQGTVTVLDGEGRFLARIKAGSEPEAIAINAETNRIYVTNAGDGTITVIDGTTDKAIATVAVGDLPYSIAANPTTNKIYISRVFNNTMSVVDGRTNIATPLQAGMQADAIAVDPLANKLYMVGYQNQEITVIDGATDHFSKINAGIHLWAITADPSASQIYAVNVGSSTVMLIDGKSLATKLVNAGAFPCAIDSDSSSGRLFVANYGGNSVTVIDRASASVVSTVAIGSQPQALAVDPANHKVYVVSTHAGTTTILDDIHNSVIATVRTGKAPFAVAVSGKTHAAVVLGMTGDLTVVNGATLETSSPSLPQ
ncbi:MAG: ThuA domain-containing protein [Candidatus Sulfotelmatobacter sp.]